VTPRYANGAWANVGDQVVGKLATSDGKSKAGVVINVTTGDDVLGVQVQYTEAVKRGPNGEDPDPPSAALRLRAGLYVKQFAGGNDSEGFVLFTCVDFGSASDLAKVG